MPFFDWSSLILFGSILNALIAIVILLNQSTRYKQNVVHWMVVFLVCVGLILLERIIRFSNLETTYPELLFITSPLFFFILPLVYVFQSRLIGKPKSWYLHFIVPILMLFVLLPSITMNNHEKLAMYTTEGINDPVWMVLLYLLFAVFYSIKTFTLNKRHKLQLLNLSASNDIELQFFSNKLLFVVNVLIITIPLSIALQYIETATLLIDKGLFILFSLIPHIILISILSMRTFNETNNLIVDKKPLKDEAVKDLQPMLAQLTNYMVENKPYINQDLNLQALADQVGWSRSHLSMVINKGFGQNFYDYINVYRLELVLQKLNDGAYREFSLDYIVSQSGFKNYTSFYRIFKRTKKTSPNNYLKQLKRA